MALARSYCCSWSANHLSVRGGICDPGEGTSAAMGPDELLLAGPEPPLMPMSLRNFSLVLSLPKLVDSHLLKEVAELGFALVEANAGWGAAGADCTVGFTSEVEDDSVLLLLHSICLFLICSAYLSGLIACGL